MAAFVSGEDEAVWWQILVPYVLSQASSLGKAQTPILCKAEEVTDHELSFQRDQDDLPKHLLYFPTCLLCFWPIKLAQPYAQAAPAGDKDPAENSNGVDSNSLESSSSDLAPVPSPWLLALSSPRLFEPWLC